MTRFDPRRSELEKAWWKRVDRAWRQYREAAEALRSIKLRYAVDLPAPDGHFAVAQGQNNELSALREYKRVLNVYGALVVNGVIPLPERSEPPQTDAEETGDAPSSKTKRKAAVR